MRPSNHGPKARVAVVIGTRPEALKLAPVVAALLASDSVEPDVIYSGQHDALLASVLPGLDLPPLPTATRLASDEPLSTALARLIESLGNALAERDVAAVVVQGDTNTTLAGALAGYHRGVPVFHVEAGLRTDDLHEPFPEEMNRRVVSRIAALHLAPTETARAHLEAEGVDPATIAVTGNPIIDAIDAMAPTGGPPPDDDRGRFVLVTLHRRESLPAAATLARSIRAMAEQRGDVEVVWVLHANAAREPIARELAGSPRVRITEPLGHAAFIELLRRASVVLTDSGGVQEEAPALGVPVLLLRSRTERPEAVDAGSCQVVGLVPERVVEACNRLLDDGAARAAMSHPARPFGDGNAAARIARAIEDFLRPRTRG